MSSGAHDQRLEKLQRAFQQKGLRNNQPLFTATPAPADPLEWLQRCTRTKDSHWQEVGAPSPYRPFPDMPYFRPLLENYEQEPIVFVAKSRDLMLSWLTVGYLTHKCLKVPGIEVLMQSQTEEKATELIDYAKCLWDQQDEKMKAAHPLTKPLIKQSCRELSLANGSRLVGIPHGASKIRSYHPWALFMDEAAFIPDAGDSYNEAVPVCKKILVVSSAGPGWFESVVTSAE